MKPLFIILLPSIASAIGIVVNTRSGTVFGSTVRYKGTPVNQFLGIPFAQPPVGDLRFKKTAPVQRSLLPIIANTYPPACIQYYPYEYPWVDNSPGQSEDCLYLNIWTPTSSNQLNPKAVLFWTYGGGFRTGSNRKSVYNGKVLAAMGDVIVVTVNYRLGVFGFLSTPSEDAPGNMGLFDALEALKWVNINIHAFGGDRNRITAFGESAGAVFTGFYCVSPLSRGLFQQVILESGSPAGLRGDGVGNNLKLGQKLAEAVGCTTKSSSLEANPEEVVECLRGKDAMELVLTVNSFNPSAINTFVPIYGDQFLPKNPREEIIRGNFQNANTLTGNVRDEFSFILPSLDPELFGPFGERNPRINKSYGESLMLEYFKEFDFRQDIVDYYLSDLHETDYNAVRSQVYQSFGDFRIFCPNLYFAESMSKKGNPVYYYYFTHRRSNSPWAPWMGVVHFDEVPFAFGEPLDVCSNYTKVEKKLSGAMVRMWTNFAKYGTPSKNWKQFSTTDGHIKLLRTSARPHNYLESHLNNCEFYRKYMGF